MEQERALRHTAGQGQHRAPAHTPNPRNGWRLGHQENRSSRWKVREVRLWIYIHTHTYLDTHTNTHMPESHFKNLLFNSIQGLSVQISSLLESRWPVQMAVLKGSFCVTHKTSKRPSENSQIILLWKDYARTSKTSNIKINVSFNFIFHGRSEVSSH